MLEWSVKQWKIKKHLPCKVPLPIPTPQPMLVLHHWQLHASKCILFMGGGGGGGGKEIIHQVFPFKTKIVYADSSLVYADSSLVYADSSQHQTHDWKVAGSNPCRSSGRIFFSMVDFLCSYFSIHSTHVTTVARKRSQSFCLTYVALHDLTWCMVVRCTQNTLRQ